MDTLTLYPDFGLSHVSDDQLTCTDSLGNSLAAQGIATIEISAGGGRRRGIRDK